MAMHQWRVIPAWKTIHKPKGGGDWSSLRKSAGGSSLNVQEIVAEVGISTGLVHSILSEDLNLQRVSVKFVLKLLTDQQKELWKGISEDMLDLANHDPEFI